MKPSRPWNWCGTCRQPINCGEVGDGSEVECVGCAAPSTPPTYFTDGSWRMIREPQPVPPAQQARHAHHPVAPESTKDQRRETTMDETTFGIGEAVKEMRGGRRVARAGWNGKGMYLAYQPGYPDGIPINANTAKATGLPEGTVCKFLPYITMRTAGGEYVPWLCSQTDLLATDWSTVS